MERTYSTFGRHIAVDAWGVDARLLNDEHWLTDQLVEAAIQAGATILGVQSKAFEPQGATVLVMLSESHISIHTYPEHGFCAIDCYTCGEDVDPELAVDHLLRVLAPERTFGKKLIRGEGELRVTDALTLSKDPVSQS